MDVPWGHVRDTNILIHEKMTKHSIWTKVDYTVGLLYFIAKLMK